MLLYTSLHLRIHFQIIVFSDAFPMFVANDEKTPQACCSENYAWCKDVFSTWQA